MKAISPIQIRKDTVDNWLYSDPILLDGELVMVLDGEYTKIKIGDGEHHFSELDYVYNPEVIEYLFNSNTYLENKINNLKSSVYLLMFTIFGIATAITIFHI